MSGLSMRKALGTGPLLRSPMATFPRKRCPGWGAWANGKSTRPSEALRREGVWVWRIKKEYL